VRDLSVVHRVRTHIETTGGNDIPGNSSSNISPRVVGEDNILGSRLGSVSKQQQQQQEEEQRHGPHKVSTPP
jgi:hypothetical protein